jgi:hypothetical protein
MPQGEVWPNRIYAVYDRIFEDVPAKRTVYTPCKTWFWPTPSQFVKWWPLGLLSKTLWTADNICSTTSGHASTPTPYRMWACVLCRPLCRPRSWMTSKAWVTRWRATSWVSCMVWLRATQAAQAESTDSTTAMK